MAQMTKVPGTDPPGMSKDNSLQKNQEIIGRARLTGAGQIPSLRCTGEAAAAAAAATGPWDGEAET